MTTPVMRDHPVAVLGEKQHLCIPRIRIQRPAMRKRDRLSLTPVLVINRRTVVGGKCVCGQRIASKCSHEGFSLRLGIRHPLIVREGLLPGKPKWDQGHTPRKGVGAGRSVSSGLAEGVATVLATLDQSRLRINGDALSIAPRMIADLHRVAHMFKSLQSLRWKTLLHKNNIGKVLLMKTRSVHSALDIQTTIGSAEENIGNCGDDAGTARRTDHETNLMVLEHDDQRHAGQG